MPKRKMTADDYWNLPEEERAELIDGELWDMIAPSRIHQYLEGQLVSLIGNHIKEHNGSCQVYQAPFAVNLFADDTTIVEPDVSVVCDRTKLSDRGCEGAPNLVIEYLCISRMRLPLSLVIKQELLWQHTPPFSSLPLSLDLPTETIVG